MTRLEDRQIRRHHVESDDVGGLADKFRVIALAPGLAA